MKAFAAFLLAAAAVVSPLVGAQRITGDQACVSACYNISTAVIQCPDLTDPGVISCICPQPDRVSLLDSCHGCIDTLSGITDLEKTSINTLYGACSNASTTASSGSTSMSSTSGSVASGSTSSPSATAGLGGAAAGTNNNTGAAFRLDSPLAMIAVSGLLALVGFTHTA